MNLENFGVQEMSTQELSIIDGGGWFEEALGDIGYAVGFTVGLAVGSVVVAANIIADAMV